MSTTPDRYTPDDGDSAAERGARVRSDPHAGMIHNPTAAPWTGAFRQSLTVWDGAGRVATLSTWVTEDRTWVELTGTGVTARQERVIEDGIEAMMEGLAP